MLKTLECCELCEEGIVNVVNLQKGQLGCCENCKEGVVTPHMGPVGVVKESTVL